MAQNDQFSKALRPDFFLEVAKESVKNHTQLIFGVCNPDIDTTAEETVWPYGGIYTYIDPTTPTELFFSSSDAGDVGQVIRVSGLKSFDSEQIDNQLIVTNGQTAVSAGEWVRVNEVRNLGPADLLGDGYLAESDTLVAGVPSTPAKVKGAIMYNTSAGRSPNVQVHPGFTPPAGYFALVRKLRFAAPSGKDVQFHTLIRPNQSAAVILPWQDAAPFNLYQSVQNLEFDGIFVDEMWDFEVRADTNANNTSVTVIFDIVLIKKD